MLFELRGPDSKRIHYLFGTMHVKDQQAYTHIDMAKICIDRCACYAAEMNLDEAQTAGIGNHFFLPEGKSLEDFFTRRQTKKFSKILKKAFHINLNDISTLLPIISINLLMEKVLNEDNHLPLDQHLWQHALSLDKIMMGVESPQEQIDVLHQIPLELQLKSFKDILKNVSKFHKSTIRLSKYYADGNIHGIYKLSKKSLGSMKKVMIYDRNFRMTDSIINLISEHSCFIALGAGHLSGKYGILALLKRANIRIKRIPNH